MDATTGATEMTTEIEMLKARIANLESMVLLLMPESQATKEYFFELISAGLEPPMVPIKLPEPPK
jgi:hypothetical protein